MTNSQLLAPITLGDLPLKNRVVMAPLTRGRAGLSRVPNKYMATYYEQRSSAGLIISEATAVSEQGYGWYATPGMYEEEHAKGWKLVTDAVHKKGGKIFFQLWHMGRQSHSSFHKNGEIVAPSAIAISGDAHTRDVNNNPVPFEKPRALNLDEIPKLIQDYQHSAQLAKVAGFDGVEIHSANGYLLDTFLQSISNHRTDQYGGSFENRSRLLREIIEGIQNVFPSNRIGVRLSPNGAFGGMGSEDNHQMFPFVAKALSSYGLAYLHVLDGLAFGWHNKCPAVTLYEIKRNFEGPMMSNAGLTKELAEGVIRSGCADLVAFGRKYISNPDLVERFAHGWPLAPDPPYADWYGRTPDPEGCLKGYIDYPSHDHDEQLKW